MSILRERNDTPRHARPAQPAIEARSMRAQGDDLGSPVPADAVWVFAYGSLMWNPDFVYEESVRATLPEYQRSLCLWSWIYRGTHEYPGLVFGLAPGGQCVGMAFRIAENRMAATFARLKQREIHADEYVPCVKPIVLENGTTAAGLVFIANTESRQYARDLDLEVVMRSIRTASRAAGSNRDYVMMTHRHCMQIGANDEYLSAIAVSLTGAGDGR